MAVRVALLFYILFCGASGLFADPRPWDDYKKHAPSQKQINEFAQEVYFAFANQSYGYIEKFEFGRTDLEYYLGWLGIAQAAFTSIDSGLKVDPAAAWQKYITEVRAKLRSTEVQERLEGSKKKLRAEFKRVSALGQNKYGIEWGATKMLSHRLSNKDNNPLAYRLKITFQHNGQQYELGSKGCTYLNKKFGLAEFTLAKHKPTN